MSSLEFRFAELSWLVAAAALALSACSDAPAVDGGVGTDAAAFDRDSGGLDSGARDSGVPAPDASTLDAAPTDAAISDSGASDGGGPTLRLPPANAAFDYQLGEPYTPPTGVQIVARDRRASPAPGVYSICYVNGFQTQPDERRFWTSTHPDLLLRDGSGAFVIDPDWDEIILDVRTEENRAALADIVGPWIVQCAADGFDAVEIDNLDTYSRSGGRVTQDNAVSFMRMLADIAHARGLPIAQKNSAEVLGRRAEMGTDFAVAEECNRYHECGDFTSVYGDLVFVIEYSRGDFRAGCRDFPELSIVLRDINLTSPITAAYVYDGC